MSSEELRRSVFSSIHMSSLVKTTHASITYPSCSFCGGCSVNPKSSPKRKVALCQVSLYSTVSDSFIVWYKKQEEPKGILWLHSCCVRRGQDSCVELISRGCRGRCSYTLKLTSLSAYEEWYRLLKLEARKTSTVGDDFTPESVDGSCSDLTSLDTMLTDISPLSSITELANFSDSEDENSDNGSVISTTPIVPPTISKSKKTRSNPSKVKVKTVFCNPFQGLGRSRKTSQPTFSTAPLDSIQNTNQPTPDVDHWSRWSWPLKA